MRIAGGVATTFTTAAAAFFSRAGTAAATFSSIPLNPLSRRFRQHRRLYLPAAFAAVSVDRDLSLSRRRRRLTSCSHPFQSRRRSPTRRFVSAGEGSVGRGEAEVLSVCNDPPLPMQVHHLASVGSTQDEAKRMLGEEDWSENRDCPICFAVSASEQLNGRGTRGRDWIGRPGNAFVTICLPSDLVNSICALTLLPLKVGTIVARQTARFLSDRGSYRNVRVKWPNDVLIDDQKVAGILIENHYDPDRMGSWFLVGVGVNVSYAPKIYQFGPQRGRRATCLAQHLPGWTSSNDRGGEDDYDNNNDDDDSDNNKKGAQEAQALAADIVRGVHAWVCAAQVPAQVDRAAEGEAIVREWAGWAEFGKEQVLRDKPGNEVVVPLGVEPDGQLRVKRRDGRIILLCADYLL